MGRFQRGSLRQEDRKAGLTWVLRHYVTRQSDGKRVEHKIPVVERQHLTEQIMSLVLSGTAPLYRLLHEELGPIYKPTEIYLRSNLGGTKIAVNGVVAKSGS